jgi:hypothetical protein
MMKSAFYWAFFQPNYAQLTESCPIHIKTIIELKKLLLIAFSLSSAHLILVFLGNSIKVLLLIYPSLFSFSPREETNRFVLSQILKNLIDKAAVWIFHSFTVFYRLVINAFHFIEI